MVVYKLTILHNKKNFRHNSALPFTYWLY